MKKSVLILMLVVALFMSGCGKTGGQLTTGTEFGGGSSSEQDTTREDSGREQSGVSDYDISGLNDYIMSVEEQSDSIKKSLEQDALTQADMNMKSLELYELWDGALTCLWDELKAELPKEEFETLQNDQLAWNGEKERSVEEAGEEAEGGTLYPLIVNSEAARMTEERVYELYTLLCNMEMYD